jgi:protein O-mannosyl-transferase
MTRVEQRPVWLAALALAVAGAAAYHNSFSVPFLFDDRPAIVANPSLQSFATSLSPPASGATVSGRPLLNLSFALNHALGGTKVIGYHVVNLAIHLLAGLALFGTVRRTLLLPRLRERFGAAATSLAFAGALLWTVHPLQTESVTYLAQRAESLAALFYLLTLYAFIRGATSRDPSRWPVLSLASCLLGVACKETVVTAPLLVLLYDRTFLAGNFRAAWRERGRWHLALAGSWALVAALALANSNRGGTAGFGSGISPWDYSLTQTRAILLYLRLALWPSPLVFDYGTPLLSGLHAIALPLIALVTLLVLTFIALRRRPALGFLGGWFFLLLAPSSSFIPIASQTIAEHRVYLPLAALSVGLVLTLHAFLRRGAMIVMGALVLACTAATVARNHVYRSALSIWSDTVAKQPSNPRAHFSLALILDQAGDKTGAESHFRSALRLDARNPEVHLALGDLLLVQRRTPEALAAFDTAIALAPASALAHFGAANALAQSGDLAAAISHYTRALELRPDYAPAHTNLATALLLAHRPEAALPHYEAVLRTDPSAMAQTNLANALAQAGRPGDAIMHYEAALALNPNLVDAHYNLGNTLVAAGRAPEAVPHFEKVLQLEPDNSAARQKFVAATAGVAGTPTPSRDAQTYFRLANDLAAKQRTAEAVAYYDEALRLNPNFAAAHTNLGKLLAEGGRIPEATPHFEAAVRLAPGDADAHANLGNALLYLGRVPDAHRHYLEALRLDPANATAKEMLAQLSASGRGAAPKK